MASEQSKGPAGRCCSAFVFAVLYMEGCQISPAEHEAWVEMQRLKVTLNILDLPKPTLTDHQPKRLSATCMRKSCRKASCECHIS